MGEQGKSDLDYDSSTVLSPPQTNYVEARTTIPNAPGQDTVRPHRI